MFLSEYKITGTKNGHWQPAHHKRGFAGWVYVSYSLIFLRIKKVMQKKWIFLTGILLCLLAALWALYSYQKPRSGVQDATADYTMSSEMLYKAFNENEAAANGRQQTLTLSPSPISLPLQPTVVA